MIFNADPDTDPVFFLIADPDPRFDNIKLKKNLQLEIYIFFSLIKNCNLLIPRPP